MLDSYLQEELISLSERRQFGEFAIYPVVRSRTCDLDVLTLDEALRAGLVEISEVSEAGSVPELRFRNLADKPVLLLDGEELQGAKQNRVLNLTILAAPLSEIVIPVSCVERGRWSRRYRGPVRSGFDDGPEMASSKFALFASAREAKMRHVSSSMKEGLKARSDQSDIWERIERKAYRMASPSATEAAARIYENHEAKIDEMVGAVCPSDGDVGAVFVIRGHVAGVEIFGSSRVFGKVWPKLARSYALEVLDRGEDRFSGTATAGQDEPRAVMEHLRQRPADRYKAVGLGDDVRIDSADVIAAGVVYDEKLVHLTAFVPA
jgi:hypothetical protein